MTLPDPTGPWSPLLPHAVGALFGRVSAPWWIAGGWAIDLFVGRQLRAHADTDVLLLRTDAGMAHVALTGWQLFAADPPGALRPWPADEQLPTHIHDIWARSAPGAPWQLQLMVLEGEGERWWFRRDHRIGGPVASLGRLSRDGLPYLAPPVQLLFKATAPRQKDEIDFAAAAPLLTDDERRWLRNALSLHRPQHHRLARL